MSATIWTVPREPLWSRIAPVAPTGTIARLGTLWPATKFRLDTTGKGVPLGKADTHPGEVGWVTVRLTTTADTPLVGIPFLPVICRTRSAPAATGARAAPLPIRVSNTRTGDTGTNAPGTWKTQL